MNLKYAVSLATTIFKITPLPSKVSVKAVVNGEKTKVDVDLNQEGFSKRVEEKKS